MSIPRKPVVCFGFAPCIQRIIEFRRLEKGAVNRAAKVTLGIGGKGANTARMVNQLGGDSLLIGFAGGTNGRLLERMLAAQGVAFHHVEVAGETRACQTLVETGNPDTTELVEEMPAIDMAEWELMAEVVDALELEKVVVPISGKLPAGVPVDAYGRIAAAAKKRGGRAIVDTPGEPLLRALEHEPFMVKINDVELMQTIGGEDLVDAALRLVGQGARSVLVTRGARTAYYVDAIQTLEIFPPVIEAVNPVGSGDAVMAGIAVGLSMEKTILEVLIDGMASGAANALNLVSGTLSPEDVDRLRPEVRVQVMGS